MLNSVLLEEFMGRFFGYGELSAPIWFIGMEESGGESIEEISGRLSAWAAGGKKTLDDLAAFHARFGDNSRFAENAPVQSTWKELMRFALLARGQKDDLESIRKYQSTEFGRLGGHVALLELMPLPKRSLEDWPYAAWTTPEASPHLKTRADYEKAIRAPRVAAIRDLITDREPKVVVFYGATYQKRWEAITRLKFKGSTFPKIARNGSTTFMLMSHPVARGAVSEQYRAGGLLAKKRLKQRPPLKFRGGIAYDNWHTGSRAQRFELRDNGTIDFELISKVDEPGVPDYHFIATAKLSHGIYSTESTQLLTVDGRDHPYGKARLSCWVDEIDSDKIKIRGQWVDVDDDEAPYPFNATLPRIYSN